MDSYQTMDSERDALTSTVETGLEFSSSDHVSEREYPPPSRLLDALTLVWRRRSLWAKVTLYGTLLTILIVVLIPNSYQSTVRLMPPDTHAGSEMAMAANLLSKTGSVGNLASNLLGTTSSGALFVGVLRSDTIAADLVNQFDLKKRYRAHLDVDARNRLAELTNISEDRKSGIITITLTDRDPRRAADLARAYVDELNRLLAEVNTSAAHRERVFIDERLREVKQALHDAAVQLSEFSAKNTTIDPKEQGKAMVGAAVTLQGELIAGETELRGLQQVYSDNNVRVRAALARIGELRHQLQELQGSDAASPTDSTQDNGPGYPTFRKLPALGVTFEDLFREVKLRETVFEMLTAQDELAKVEEAKEIPTVKVLDPAEVPEKKSGPPRLGITILGALLSFGVGVVWILGSAVWTNIDPDDPRKRFATEIWQDVRPWYARGRRFAIRFSRKPKVPNP